MHDRAHLGFGGDILLIADVIFGESVCTGRLFCGWITDAECGAGVGAIRSEGLAEADHVLRTTVFCVIGGVYGPTEEPGSDGPVSNTNEPADVPV